MNRFYLVFLYLYANFTYSQTLCLGDSLDISTGYNPIVASVAVKKDPKWKIVSASQDAKDNCSELNILQLPDSAFVLDQVNEYHGGLNQVITYPENKLITNKHRVISCGRDPLKMYNDITIKQSQQNSIVLFERNFKTCQSDSFIINYNINADNRVVKFTIDGISFLSKVSTNFSDSLLLFLPAGNHIIQIEVKNDYAPTWSYNEWNPIALFFESFIISKSKNKTILLESDINIDTSCCSTNHTAIISGLESNKEFQINLSYIGEKKIGITYVIETTKNINFEILTLDGRKIIRKKLFPTKGVNNIEVDAEQISSGMYLINFMADDKVLKIKKITIN